MMFARTQSGKLVWQRAIAVFICLLLHHMKRAMSAYTVLIKSCMVTNRLLDVPAPGTAA